MENIDEQKINEQDIDFFKERKTSRLLREYYEHKEKRISGLIDLKKNLSLANQLSNLLKDNENDVDLIHSKKVIMDYCLQKFKNIKKEDSEMIDAENRVNNDRVSTLVEEELINNSSSETNRVHEEAKLVLKKYYEMKGC